VVAAVLIGALAVAALVVRIVAVAALRRRHPDAAAFVARNWTWLPMVAAVVVLTLWWWPLGALAAALATVIVARPGSFGLPSR
jgi:hypothetical protein